MRKAYGQDCTDRGYPFAELNYHHHMAMEFLPLGDPVKALVHRRQEALQTAQVHRS
jgi:hypothetical protein